MDPVTLNQNERMPLHCLTEIAKTCQGLYEFHQHPKIDGAQLTRISVRNSNDINHNFFYDLVYCGPEPGDITKLCYSQVEACRFIDQKYKDRKVKK